jgi:hypothetical protein
MKVGRPKNMNDPKELMELWIQYKSFVDSTPDKIEQATPKGDVVKISVRKPYLKQGFESFVFKTKGFSVKDYLSNKYDEFSDVVTCIRNEWEDDQISGTMTGRYKAPNLVARLNGLADSQNHNIQSEPRVFKID